MKDQTFNCQDCKKEVREKSITPELASLKLCPRCYTLRMTRRNKKGGNENGN